MIIYYVKTAWRNLKKNKLNTVITISGFGIALALVMLVSLFSWKELTVNQFHKDAGNIYKISGWGTPAALAPFLEERIPEMESVVTIMGGQRNDMKIKTEKNEILNVNNLILTEDTFFDVFTFPLVSGNGNLTKPYTAILTQKLARRFFGDENPLGKTVTSENGELQIVGVAKNPPENSSLKFDMLISLNSLKEVFRKEMGYELKDDWKNFSFETFAKFKNPVDKEELTDKIQKTIKEQGNLSYDVKHVKLYTLKDLYFNSSLFSNFKRGNEKNVKTMMAIGIIILILAVINFFNLTTSQGISRAKEIGVRKANGGTRVLVAAQVFCESFILSFFAMLLAFILANIAIPWFNSITSSDFDFLYMQKLWHWILLLGGSIIMTAIAGSYPAFYLSSFNATEVIKVNKMKGKGVESFRKVLVVFQFAASIVLFISMFFITKQLNFFKNKDLGFEKDAILCIKPTFNENIEKKYDTYLSNLYQNPAIMGISNVNGYLGNIDMGIRLYTQVNGEEKAIWSKVLIADTAFFNTFNVKINDEIIYNRERPQLFINQAALDALNATSINQVSALTDYLNFHFTGQDDDKRGYVQVAGVTGNFNYKSLKYGVEPLLLIINPKYKGILNVNFNLKSYNSIDNLVNYCESIREKLVPEVPFEYELLDDVLSQSYENEKRFQTIIVFLAVFAMLISCLGLIGMVVYSNSKRVKEIGVRKILGAEVKSILSMLVSGYTKWVIVAFVIAVPIAWNFMNSWISNFPYRIKLSWWGFLIAGIGIYIIAIMTVMIKSLRVATGNPVNALRYE